MPQPVNKKTPGALETKRISFLESVNASAAKDRLEFYAKMYGICALNTKEIRELEGMNPYDGGKKISSAFEYGRSC